MTLVSGTLVGIPVALACEEPRLRRVRYNPRMPPELLRSNHVLDVVLPSGERPQTWLAVNDHPDATRSGGYCYHQRRQSPDSAALDEGIQDALLDQLRLTDVRLS